MKPRAPDESEPRPNVRKHPRHDLTCFVWFQAIAIGSDEAQAPGPEGLCYVADISRGGLGMITQEPMALGTLLLVRVVFEALGYDLAAVCRVIHCSKLREASHRVGLQFVTLPPDCRQFLFQHFA